MTIVVDGVEFDLVVQEDWGNWIVADSDGTVLSRHQSEAVARDFHQRFERMLREAAQAAP